MRRVQQLTPISQDSIINEVLARQMTQSNFTRRSQFGQDAPEQNTFPQMNRSQLASNYIANNSPFGTHQAQVNDSNYMSQQHQMQNDHQTSFKSQNQEVNQLQFQLNNPNQQSMLEKQLTFEDKQMTNPISNQTLMNMNLGANLYGQQNFGTLNMLPNYAMIMNQNLFNQQELNQNQQMNNIKQNQITPIRTLLGLHINQHSKMQPDNFVHVKRFTNLDRIQHNSHENSNADNCKDDEMSESILLSEPIAQVLEETPNSMFHQMIQQQIHHEYQKTNLKGNQVISGVTLLKQQLELLNGQIRQQQVVKPTVQNINQTSQMISPNIRARKHSSNDELNELNLKKHSPFLQLQNIMDNSSQEFNRLQALNRIVENVLMDQKTGVSALNIQESNTSNQETNITPVQNLNNDAIIQQQVIQSPVSLTTSQKKKRPMLLKANSRTIKKQNSFKDKSVVTDHRSQSKHKQPDSSSSDGFMSVISETMSISSFFKKSEGEAEIVPQQQKNMISDQKQFNNIKTIPEEVIQPRQEPYEKMIGPLTLRQRQEKIMKFIMKKRQKTMGKKFTYECRKQVAEKRLRIKGRFVTKQQAFDILGLKQDDLKSNDSLQRLLEQHYNISTQNQNLYISQVSQIMHHQLSRQNQLQMDQKQTGAPMIQLNSLVENAQGNKLIKIRNFQALFDDFEGGLENTGFAPQPELENLDNQKINSGAVPQQKDSKTPSVSDPMETLRSQQVSVLELQEALQQQSIPYGAQGTMMPVYLPSLFKIEKIQRNNIETQNV